MGKPGRIPKITQEKADRFCEAISNGMSVKFASALIGVTPRSVQRWIVNGKSGVGGKVYVHFVAKIAESEARFIEKNLKSVQRAAAPRKVRTTKTYTRGDGSSSTEVTEKVEYDWAAARWLLECKDRESFGPDRAEIAALKKDIGELRKLLSEAIGKVAGDQAVDPKTAPARSSPETGVPPAPRPVDSGSADGTPVVGGVG